MKEALHGKIMGAKSSCCFLGDHVDDDNLALKIGYGGTYIYIEREKRETNAYIMWREMEVHMMLRCARTTHSYM